jgi:hypothetical protein
MTNDQLEPLCINLSHVRTKRSIPIVLGNIGTLPNYWDGIALQKSGGLVPTFLDIGCSHPLAIFGVGRELACPILEIRRKYEKPNDRLAD